ncbi:uncharacterized protein [Physcomitrium patens]|uniref:Uncharacterized protein n=1 Tax=Physcomitrium patens TaxID=3218 RepID=A0A2K1KD63_PHYPA|nr:uncharacterized protein LOC112284475 [Physcomitrium patens]XP_024380061.1 uncharacterized protein LOC112284475 [Physcomitrium patens]XP_024380062.1 uncharacterized protein LOC112284475 [Physcomitrium patens]XP_024380063.1 uncharacterized protein LOC112284475 [Physcomitrium patens]XP_024380064.1 uncharacterized protein LOC112284475 [Physcomitrium patens]PNR51689.1 hypothetical protein PHYPA_010877 [Physcomitrium patens]|eukprot:XP_024380060.1 uncharacterized protein LOC112284475 [Physcomitrella patens]
MAEEGSNSPSQGTKERTSFRDDTTPYVKDRRSLTGMSEKVKAALAPLLGGSKHYSEVEVDLGRESEAATYETVPMGSTSMTRLSTVAGTPEEHGASTAAATTESVSSNDSDRLPAALRDHLPVQSVGIGGNATSSAVSGGKHGPGHNPNEDKYVLDGTKDPVDRFSNTSTS